MSLLYEDCSPPPGWREDPEFLLYLSELGSCGAARLAGEPDRVALQLAELQQQTRNLAANNYKTFIQTSQAGREIGSELSEAETHLGSLVSQLQQFRGECGEFSEACGELARHRRLTSLTLAKHTALLEVRFSVSKSDATCRSLLSHRDCGAGVGASPADGDGGAAAAAGGGAPAARIRHEAL